MSDFTVIMPVYVITEELLDLTKEALQTVNVENLIIIDNASTIGGGYLRSIAKVYIRNQGNLGYACAVNQGLKLAKTEYLAIANNDIRVSPNWKEVAREALGEKGVYSCHFRMTDYDTPFEYGNSIIYRGKERWCHGSFYVIKGEPLLLDESYINSYDDWDLFHRVRMSGKKQAYTDKACFQHKHSTTQQLIPEREENDRKNREYFREKWGDYAENLFAKEFPEQMSEEYQKGWTI